MKDKKLKDGQKLGRQYRNVSILATKATELDEESRMVRNVSVSSDEPYERWYGTEILLHEKENIDLTRVTSNAAPLLFNHNRDSFLGKISNPVLKDGKLYVDFKFSTSEDAAKMLADVKDGLLTECSIGYDVSKFEVDEDEETYTATFWTLYEVSLVTLPADATVGVGRDAGDEREIEIRKTEKTSRTDENDVDRVGKPSQKRETSKEITMTDQEKAAQELKETQAREKADAELKEQTRASEQARIREIYAIGARAKVPTEVIEKAIEDNTTEDAFRKMVFEKFWNGKAAEPIDTPTGEADLDGGRVAVVGERGKDSRRLTAGERFVNAKGFKEFVASGKKGEFRANVGGSILRERGLVQRAGFTSSDLASINVTISQEMISLGVQRLTIMDLLAGGVMTTAGFIYPVENSFDPFAEAAQTVPERGLKPEWEPDISTARADAQVLAVMATVPKQFMADFGAFGSWLNSRGDYLLQIKAEQQILYGDGLGSNLLGITARAGIQTRAYGTVGSETTPDALFRGNTDIETNSYFDVDGFAMHPYDFEQIRLLKDANGQYLGGGPFYAPYGTGTFIKYHTVWGLPCVVTKSVKQGRPIAGAWKMGAQWFLREGLQIETSTSHKDYFQRNLLAVLFEERMALAVYRPVAFLEHTGFPGRG